MSCSGEARWGMDGIPSRKICFAPLFGLLIFLCLSSNAVAQSTYRNSTIGFTFEAPNGTDISDQTDFDGLINDGESHTGFTIEDWTKDANREKSWNFEKIADDRATVPFLADGPDNSISGSIQTKTPFDLPGIHGFKYLIRISGNLGDEIPDHGYSYVFDISKDEKKLVLIFSSGLKTNFVKEELMDRTLKTLRRLSENSH